MNLAWEKFRTDRLYLTKYLAKHLLAFSSAGLSLWYFKGIDLRFEPSLSHLFLLPLCILVGIQVPVLMHNCMHGNIRNHHLNALVGEMSAFFALSELGVLQVNHLLHHAHADTEQDPHSPQDKGFLAYFFAGQFTGARIIEEKFLSFHGRSEANKALFKLNSFLHYAGQPLRLALWFLILGPALFVAFYLPTFLVYSLAFAHVNYVTHHQDEKGRTVIINKDDNLYYNFVNFIGSGVYYHKNHHRYPKLMNPKHADRTQGRLKHGLREAT